MIPCFFTKNGIFEGFRRPFPPSKLARGELCRRVHPTPPTPLFELVSLGCLKYFCATTFTSSSAYACQPWYGAGACWVSTQHEGQEFTSRTREPRAFKPKDKPKHKTKHKPKPLGSADFSTGGNLFGKTTSELSSDKSSPAVGGVALLTWKMLACPFPGSTDIVGLWENLKRDFERDVEREQDSRGGWELLRAVGELVKAVTVPVVPSHIEVLGRSEERRIKAQIQVEERRIKARKVGRVEADLESDGGEREATGGQKSGRQDKQDQHPRGGGPEVQEVPTRIWSFSPSQNRSDPHQCGAISAAIFAQRFSAKFPTNPTRFLRGNPYPCGCVCMHKE
jgi:hypothetical protein